MGILSLFSRHKTVTPEPDAVWVNREAKLNALASAAEQGRAAGAVIVLAHFASTMQIIQRQIGPRLGVQRTVGESELLGILAAPEPGTTALAMARELPQPSAGAAPGRAGRLSILVAERYPIRDRDDAICRAATALSYPCTVRFYLAIDDPLLTSFGGERLTTIMEALGVGENEEVGHPLVASAVANAQAKIARHARSDVDAASAEDWFQLNLP